MTNQITIEGSNNWYAEPNDKISVFITNYNHAHYLGKSIESVLNQTYKDIELIIVDDGSTDNSLDVICHYRELDPRIKTEIFPKNQGCFAAIATAMKLSKSEYIFPRAADDYLVDMRFLQRAIEAMKFYPTVAGAFGGSVIITPNGETVGRMGFRDEMDVYISPEKCQKDFLERKLFVPGASAIWRRRLVDLIGGFDADLGPQSDYYINHVLPMIYGVVDLHTNAAAVLNSDESFSKTDRETYLRRLGIFERKIRSNVPQVDQDNLWTEWRNKL